MRLPALAVALLVVSCQTTEIRRRHFSEPAEMRVAAHERTWEIHAGDELVGLLAFFESRGPAQDSLYLVRNLWHQDLGIIDAFGRAFRYLPHQRDPVWVGSGTIAQGIERILEAEDPCRLVEVPLAGAPEARAESGVETPRAPEQESARSARESGAPAVPPDRGFAQSREGKRSKDPVLRSSERELSP